MSTPREALAAFSNVVQAKFEPWYDLHSRRCYQWYLGLQLLMFVASIATAVFAALSNGKNFDSWAKYVIVLLPLVGATATTILSQFRLYDLWKLREEGRIQIQAIVLEADRRAASATSETECAQIHKELADRVNKIEQDQSVSFFSLYKSDMVLSMKQQKSRNDDGNVHPETNEPVGR